MELGDDWNQKKISLLESKEVVDDALLEEVAKALKVSPQAIKNFDEQAAINIIGNSYHDHAYSNVNFQCTINPLERWLESLEENKKLYERLLQAEKEKMPCWKRCWSKGGEKGGFFFIMLHFNLGMNYSSKQKLKKIESLM